MDEVTMLSNLTQFGTAGVIGWLWLNERRSSAQRERELTEAHGRVVTERESLEQVMRVVTENTSALSELIATQRSLGDAVDRLTARLDSGGAVSDRRAG